METHLPARNELPIRSARHLDLPQVRRPSAMDGPALAAQLSRAMRPEEIRRVRDPENALLPERQRAVPGAVAGDRLHDRTVDAPVEHAVGLVVLRTGHEPRPHPFGRHLEHLEPERSAPRVGLRNPIVRPGHLPRGTLARPLTNHGHPSILEACRCAKCFPGYSTGPRSIPRSKCTCTATTS